MEFKTELKNFTLFARLGGNVKTGKGLMLSILPKTGLDLDTVRSEGSSACGDCVHAKKRDGRKTGTCYTYRMVGGSQGVLGGINNGFNRCENINLIKFTKKVEVLAELTGFIRVGEFGDPAADKQVAGTIADILKVIDSEVVRAGYTHQWKKKKAESLKGLIMASCDSEDETKAALNKDWGVFEVIGRKEEPTTTQCPNQKDKGSITCDKCGMCNGDKKVIQIKMH